MILASSVLTQISMYLLYILIPLIALYLGYLIITKAFQFMGFTSFEAIIIVFVSFLLGSGIVDEYVGFSFSNIQLFAYGNWIVGINTGGALIPIMLSIYLYIKNKLQYSKVFLGIIIVAIITFFVTEPIPEKGIVARFPFWLLPIFFASLASIILYWKDIQKAAPFAYISGTLGVLIGADFFHLLSLLGSNVQTTRFAVIGGASIFDMVFITGILAVIVDGLLTFKKRKKDIIK
jgi:uncharacterized membrane protein